MIVVISGSLYDKCDESSGNMSCNNNSGTDGKGYGNCEEDPRRVERTGRLGEAAYGIIMDEEVDWRFLKGGDNMDFMLGTFTVDVKNTIYYPNQRWRRKKSVVKYINNKGNKCHIKDIYVCFETVYEDRVKRFAELQAHGWLCHAGLENLPNVPSVDGVVQNKELYFNKLMPMDCLIGMKQLLEDI